MDVLLLFNIDSEKTYSSAAKDGPKAHSLAAGSAASLACIQCVVISHSCFYYSQLFSIVLEAQLTPLGGMKYSNLERQIWWEY